MRLLQIRITTKNTAFRFSKQKKKVIEANHSRRRSNIFKDARFLILLKSKQFVQILITFAQISTKFVQIFPKFRPNLPKKISLAIRLQILPKKISLWMRLHPKLLVDAVAS